MKKIIKLVLILGILAFSMLNLVQAQDKVLCCPEGTTFDEGTKICYGVTLTTVSGRQSPLALPKNPYSPGALRVQVKDNNCNNVFHDRISASWKIVKTISTEPSEKTPTSSIGFVKGPSTFPNYFLYVVRDSNRFFIEKTSLYLTVNIGISLTASPC